MEVSTSGASSSIADALPLPLALIDRDQRYLFCNQALADFLERPRNSILGQKVGEVIGEAAYDIRKPLIVAALNGERQWFAAEYDHPSRGTVAIQTQYLPQVADDGSISGIVILITDVTEQRVAERAIRESEARFRRIANNAPVIMWVTRLDRHREFVNDAYLSFTGVARDRVNDHDWRDFIHPDDFERIVVESMAGEATRRRFNLEARYKRADGVYRWLQSASSPRFGPDGELVGFIGAAFDVTVAKEAELELRRQVDKRTAEVTESEARLRAIFDSVREVVVLLEPDGTVLQLNRTTATWRNPRAAGGDRQEIVGSADVGRLSRTWRCDARGDQRERRTASRSIARSCSSGRECRPLISTFPSARSPGSTGRSCTSCSKRATSPSSRLRRSSFGKARRWRRSAS